MLKLYHVPKFRSTRALWMYLELQALYEKSSSPLPRMVVHEFTDVARFRNDKPDWYLKLNPNGKVPTLVNDDKKISMWDSCAVAYHLIENYDTDNLLLPKDPAARALYQQLAFYASGTIDNLNSTSSPVQRGKMILSGGAPARMNPDPEDESFKLGKTAWMSYVGPYLEEVLTKHEGPYILGSTFSALDVMLGSSLYGMHEKPITRGDGVSWLDETKFPNLTRFHQLVSQREARKVAYSPTQEWPPTHNDGCPTPTLEPVKQ